MKKLIAVACAVLFLGAALALAADAPKGPIKVTHYGTEKAATTFNHDTHKAEACDTCHHKMKETPADMKCGGCHKDEAAMKDAAHKKEVGKCWGCHNKNSANVKKEMKCDECHK
jgi:Zn finger protein HypA/HybF involved in hydrogenase expression